MKKSVDHILTTHTGSLPRGEELNDLLIADEAGEKVDKAKLDRDDRQARRLCDGEAALGRRRCRQRWRAGPRRLSDLPSQAHVGLRRRIEAAVRPGMDPAAALHRKVHGAHSQDRKSLRLSRKAIADIKYTDKEAIKIELARFKRHADAIKPPFPEMFFAEPSPGIIACTMLNAHYATYEDYLNAIAREMNYEYKAVVDAGYILQIDAPDLAMERVLLFQDKTEAEFVKITETAHRLDQQGAGWNSTRSRAAAHLLGQLGGAAHFRHRPRTAAASVLSGQCRRALASSSPMRAVSTNMPR